MFYVSCQLQYTPHIGQVNLRELRGFDEISLGNVGTSGAITLLDALLQPNAGQAISAAALVTADRDAVMGALYKRLFGHRIESTLTCTCSQKFDLDFSLDDFAAHLLASREQGGFEVTENGQYSLSDGADSFRLPTGQDELAVLGLSPEEASNMLVALCIDKGSDLIKSQAAMAAIAPVWQTDMAAQCPECGDVQSVLFDMQGFLLRRLLQERDSLAAEVHLLAMAYKWSYNDIMNLPRSQRKMFVSLIT